MTNNADDPGRVVERPLSISFRLALGRNQARFPVERGLPFGVQPRRNGGDAVDVGRVETGKAIGQFSKQASHVVPVGRLHARLPEHSLEREFDDSLRFPDDVGVRLFTARARGRTLAVAR